MLKFYAIILHQILNLLLVLEGYKLPFYRKVQREESTKNGCGTKFGVSRR